jgi:hypothetical protein
MMLSQTASPVPAATSIRCFVPSLQTSTKVSLTWRAYWRGTLTKRRSSCYLPELAERVAEGSAVDATGGGDERQSLSSPLPLQTELLTNRAIRANTVWMPTAHT